MVFPALENDAKNMTSVTHDGVDITAKVIGEVADILGNIELRFDFNPSQKQMKRMQGEYFDEYLQARTSLIKAGEEYVNSKEDLQFALEDQSYYRQEYYEGRKDKSIGVEELQELKGKSLTSRKFYVEQRDDYVTERDEYSMAKVDYFQAASNYYESKVYPKQAWRKYLDKLEHQKSLSPEIESLSNGLDLSPLNSDDLEKELADFDARLSSLIESKEGGVKSGVSTEINVNQNVDETVNNFETDSPLIESKEGGVKSGVSTEINVNQNPDESVNNFETDSPYQMLPDPWLENIESHINVTKKSSQYFNDYYLNQSNFDVEIDPQTGLITDPWFDNNPIPNNHHGVNMENTSFDNELTDLILDPNTELVDFDARVNQNENNSDLTSNAQLELENFDAQLELSSEINPELTDFDARLESSQFSGNKSPNIPQQETHHSETIKVSKEEKFEYFIDESIYTTSSQSNYFSQNEAEDISTVSSDVKNESRESSFNNPTPTPTITENSVENQIIADGISNFLELQETNRYETDNYIIERNDGEISISAKDDSGEVFHVDESGNIESNLSLDESQNFVDFSALVNEKFEEVNNINEVSSSESEYDLVENQVIYDGVENFLDVQETNRYETHNYIIERNNGEISINAKDGRGEVFVVSQDGNIDSQLNLSEREELVNFSLKVDNIVNQKIAEGVDSFLSLQETDSYETNKYLLQKSDDGEISIAEIDTGFDVFRIDNTGDIIDTNLSREETKNFLEFSENVSKVMANNQIAKATVEKVKEELEL